MRKILFLGALALLASTAAACAATKVALTGYCNVYSIRNDHGTLSVKDTGCSEGFGAGFIATIHGLGKTEVIGLQDPGSSHTQFVFRFSYPLTNGGTWSLHSSTDGLHTNPLASGNYTLPTPGKRLDTHGLKSATSRQ